MTTRIAVESGMAGLEAAVPWRGTAKPDIEVAALEVGPFKRKIHEDWHTENYPGG